MAVIIKTSDPAGLLKAIYASIDDNNIRTWTYDSDKDFTHSPEQWNRQAWLRPRPVTTLGELRLGILIGAANYNKSITLYAIYHGRFIEMLLSHFDSRFTSAYATALPTNDDSISNPNT